MYHSTDLIHWRYIGADAVANAPITGKPDTAAVVAAATVAEMSEASPSQMVTVTSSDDVNLANTVPVSTKISDRTIPLALLQQLQQHHQLMRQEELKMQAQLNKEKREREWQLDEKLQQEIKLQEEAEGQQYLKRQQELKKAQQLMRKNELRQQKELKKQQEMQQQQQQDYHQETQEQQMQTQEQEMEKEAVDCEADVSSEDSEPEEVMQVQPGGGEGDEREMYLAHAVKKRKWVLQKQRQREMSKAQKQQKQVKVSVPTNPEQPRRLFTCQYCPFATTFGNRYRSHSNNHALGFEFLKVQRAKRNAAAIAHRIVDVDEHEEKSQCPFCSFKAQGPTGVCRHVRVHFDFQRYLEIRGFEVKYERCWLDTDTIEVKSKGKSSTAQSAKS